MRLSFSVRKVGELRSSFSEALAVDLSHPIPSGDRSKRVGIRHENRPFDITATGQFALVQKPQRDFAIGLAPWALFLLCVVVGKGIALRTRNVLFLPHTSALFVAGALSFTLERRRGARLGVFRG